MRFMIEVQPRFDYGRAEHEVEMHPHGVVFRSPDLTLALEGAIAKAMGSRAAASSASAAASARRSTSPPASRRRSCSSACRRTTSPRPYPERRDGGVVRRDGRLLAALASAQSRYKGRWREMVTARR